MTNLEQELAKFWSRVEIPKHGYWRNKCWSWQGALSTAWSQFGGDGSGYGVMRSGTVTWRAHRWIYTQLKGAIPEGLVIRHSCDNRKCVNPAHLSTGTQKENCADTRRAREQRVPF